MAVMPTTVRLDVSPKKLIRDLPLEERNRSPILLDVIAKQVQEQALILELDVVFQSIAITRGVLLPANYYIGIMAAQVHIRGTEADLLDYTKSASLSVEYDITTGSENGEGQKISPEAKVGDVDLKVGEVESSTKKTQSSTAKFVSQELLLVATAFPDAIRWNIDTHRAGKIVRDFFIGNQPLQATFKWKCTSRSGEIQLVPEIRFFDPNKRPLSRRASILMRFVLWRRGIRLANERGLQLSFVETV